MSMKPDQTKPTEKQCTKCKRWGEEEEEFGTLVRPDGVVLAQGWCKECRAGKSPAFVLKN